MVWPKLTVSDYSEMLRKLSVSVFIVTIVCVWLLRSHVAAADKLFDRLDLAPGMVLLGYISIPVGTFLVAVVVAFIFESVKLHDKISEIFNIRAMFDVRWILIPMALLSGAVVTSAQYDRITAERRRLMREVFYKYASSAKAAQIDVHLIIQALTAWSWYWLCVEAIAIIIPTALLLAWFSQWTASTIMIALAMFLQLLMSVFRNEANKYAEAEVGEILADDARRQAVRSVFDAL